MKRNGLLLAVGVLAGCLGGCPFEAKVPLGEPQRPLDERLVGNWVWDDPEGKQDSVLIVVLPFNESEYLVEVLEAGKEPERYRAYRVKVGDQALLSINEIGTAGYHFAPYEVQEGGRLSLRFVDEKGVPEKLASDAAGLLEHLRAHLADPALFGKEPTHIVLRRPKPDEVEEGRLRK